MTSRPERFTIRSLMIAIVVVAVLLALPIAWGVLVVALAIPCLAVIGAHWLVSRGQRRVAAVSFWALALLINVFYAACCIAPEFSGQAGLYVGWFVIVLPTTIALGSAWVRLWLREHTVERASQAIPGLSVGFLAVLPVLTLATFWPLRLAFLVAWPALDLLADQVAAARTVVLPRQAGVFRVVGSAIDSRSGDVGLLLDASPGGPTGFVRIRPSARPNYAGPIAGSDLEVDLGWGWRYRVED